MASFSQSIADATEEINRRFFEAKRRIDELPISDSAKREALKILREHCDSAIQGLTIVKK